MCKKTQFKYCPSTIDPCMINLVNFINSHKDLFKTLSCCCGHEKYPKTIVIKDLEDGRVFEVFSNITMTRKKKFYKKDKQGYYYIPEVLK